MTHSSHSDIDRYESQARALHQWIDGLSPADLDAHPVPGKWSMRQLVVHLLDSDLTYGHRMRKLAAEEKPLIMAYDETLWASAPALQIGDLKVVASIFEMHRHWMAGVLRALPADAWNREGVHSQRGIVTVGKLLSGMVEHVTMHEPFAVAKREKLGKPMRETVGASR